jgi:hypothetical protein
MNIPVTRIVLDRAAAPAVWVSTGAGLLKSSDDGFRYEPSHLRPAGQRQPSILAIAIHPNDANTVYVGTELEDGLIWKTTDGGRTWKVFNTGLAEAGGPGPRRQIVESAPQTQ